MKKRAILITSLLIVLLPILVVSQPGHNPNYAYQGYRCCAIGNLACGGEYPPKNPDYDENCFLNPDPSNSSNSSTKCENYYLYYEGKACFIWAHADIPCPESYKLCYGLQSPAIRVISGEVCRSSHNPVGISKNSLCYPNNDYDQDGVEDPEDNCPAVKNEFEYRIEEVPVGMECDNQGNCHEVFEEIEIPFQPDEDSDGVGDACDNCISEYNPEQEDADRDDIGDACDTETCDDNIDNDGDSKIDCEDWIDCRGKKCKYNPPDLGEMGLIIEGKEAEGECYNRKCRCVYNSYLESTTPYYEECGVSLEEDGINLDCTGEAEAYFYCDETRAWELRYGPCANIRTGEKIEGQKLQVDCMSCQIVPQHEYWNDKLGYYNPSPYQDSDEEICEIEITFTSQIGNEEAPVLLGICRGGKCVCPGGDEDEYTSKGESCRCTNGRVGDKVYVFECIANRYELVDTYCSCDRLKKVFNNLGTGKGGSTLTNWIG